MTMSAGWYNRINSPCRDPTCSSGFMCRRVRGSWHALAGAGSGPAGGKVEDGRGGLGHVATPRFPVPARQTGRADS